MADLLDYLVEARGGLKRWNELESVSAHLRQGGVTWEMKGQKGVLDDVYVTTSLHEERVSHHPFGSPGRRSVFTPERVTIENEDGTVVEVLDQPRASFAGHTLPGGGYAVHAPHEAEPVARWLGEIGVQATVQFAVLGYAITSMET
jgi:hypothetical protein